MTPGIIFGGCLILIYQNWSYKVKITRFPNKQKLRKKSTFITINMFFIQTLINNNLFKNNHEWMEYTALRLFE